MEFYICFDCPWSELSSNTTNMFEFDGEGEEKNEKEDLFFLFFFIF